MDAFVKIKTQKKTVSNTLHQKEIDLLRTYINEGKNVMICGASGTGKSFILNAVLDEYNSIEITPDLKFKDELRNSKMTTYLDDYRHEVIAQRQIVDRVSEGNPFTKGSFIVCSTSVYLISNFKLIILPKRTPEQIASLRPGVSGAMKAAEACKGNIHNFFHYIEFSDEKDEFIEPKEVAVSLLCDREIVKSSDAMCEHGHVWGIVHENYPESSNVNIHKISQALSDADLHDSSIYNGFWDSMLYFTNSIISTPAYYLGEKIDKTIIRPGSFWTKYGNYKMRSQKLGNISRKTRGMSHQELSLMRQYAKQGNMEMYTQYKLTPQDFDVINHLCIGNKLKPREVSQIKKKIKEYINVHQ
jgi:hypothetical protein